MVVVVSDGLHLTAVKREGVGFRTVTSVFQKILHEARCSTGAREMRLSPMESTALAVFERNNVTCQR